MATPRMIINCGNRRLVKLNSYTWQLEILYITEDVVICGKRTKPENVGKTKWVADNPAYPSNLGHGLQLMLERIMCDEAEGECDITSIPDLIMKAQATLRGYLIETGNFKLRESNDEPRT